MFGQNQQNRKTARKQHSNQTGRHQPDMAVNLEENSVHLGGYDNLAENVVVPHLLAIPPNLIMTSLQEDANSYTAAGVLDPSDTLQSSMEAMNNLSLNDINPSIQFLDGPLDLELYMDGTKDNINNRSTNNYHQDPYSASYDLLESSSNSFDTYDSIRNQTNYPDDYGGLDYADLQYADQNYSAQSFSSIHNHSGGFQDYQTSSASSLQDSLYSSIGCAEQVMHYGSVFDTHQTQIYSQQSKETFGSHGAENTLQLPPTSSSSRKGYKHRHERVYGLSEEDKKKRSQVLNNEASQLYRERKSKKVKDEKDQMELQEERNRKLLRDQKRLQRQMAILQQALNSNSLPQNNSTLEH